MAAPCFLFVVYDLYLIGCFKCISTSHVVYCSEQTVSDSSSEHAAAQWPPRDAWQRNFIHKFSRGATISMGAKDDSDEEEEGEEDSESEEEDSSDEYGDSAMDSEKNVDCNCNSAGDSESDSESSSASLSDASCE
jgi:hypothetical protein